MGDKPFGLLGNYKPSFKHSVDADYDGRLTALRPCKRMGEIGLFLSNAGLLMSVCAQATGA